MKLALLPKPLSDENLRLASQIGVTDIVTSLPPEQQIPSWDYSALFALHKRVEEAGFTWSVIETIPIPDRVKLGLPGRDEDIANFCQSIVHIGAVGIPIVCYNWMASFSWLRTSTTTPTRGGALVTSFSYEDIRNAPLTEVGNVSDEQLWDAYEYFLKRVIPVAEKAKVKLAIHPDDPPMSPIRGVARILRSPDAFKRVIDLVSSDYNGICFCQGTFASAGADLEPAVRFFAERKKLFFVHFRDVRGTVPAFEETFHDDGKTNMAAMMRVYVEIGFDGPIRPDHVPTMDGETNEYPGYHMLGRLFAIGYMKGLIDAIHYDNQKAIGQATHELRN